MSLRELATRTSVSQSAVMHIVNGKVSPRDKTRMELAAALGCEVDRLFPYPTIKGEK